ncbi:hypothetical protein D3C80_1235140 [compost metagenome]
MRFIRKVLGALPMPTMKTRLRPRFEPSAASIWSSLLIEPSVRKITWRTRPASSGVSSTRAALSAGSISVPPLASS